MTTSPPPTPRRPPMNPASGVRDIKLAPHQTTDAVTATKDLFVLAHLGIPRVDPSEWRLAVDGLVEHHRSVSLNDLKALPKRSIEAVHQCCGSPLAPRVPTRRVSNLRWGGVDLAQLLGEIGITPQARFLWAYGLDGGSIAGTSCDWFVKDMPLERLAAGDVLLAYELNHAPLPAEHGFPLRLVVPGYYGTNSVKWLWRLQLAAQRADSPFTTRFYNDDADPADIAAGMPKRRPVWAIAPEAIIVAPAPDAGLVPGQLVEIRGWAWSFRGIARVDVSVDDGMSFMRATLAPRRGWAWQRFSSLWLPTERGEVTICARACDADGIGQPAEGARNAIHAIRVVVQ